MSYPEKPRSDLWYLLPMFVGLLGGIIVFVILRNSDPKKAINSIYLALILLLRDLLMLSMIASEYSEIVPGFNVNI